MNKIATIFKIMSLVGLLIVLFWLFQVDYSDLSFKNNRSAYFGIATMAVLLITLQMIRKQIKNKKK